MPPTILEKAGPEAFSRLRTYISDADLSVIPSELEFHANSDSKYVSTRLRLAECEAEGNHGYLWAYIARSSSPKQRPRTRIFAEMALPGTSETEMIHVLRGNRSYDHKYAVLDDVLSLFHMQNDEELYALVAYAFMRAAHDSEHGFIDHIVPIDDAFIQHLTALCRRPEFQELLNSSPEETAIDHAPAGASVTTDPPVRIPALNGIDGVYNEDMIIENTPVHVAPQGTRKRDAPMDEVHIWDRRVKVKLRVRQPSENSVKSKSGSHCCYIN